MTTQEKEILRTLAYSDIFKFPLTKEELWRFLISDRVKPRASYEQSVQHLVAKKLIIANDGYFTLAAHAGDIVRRRENGQLLQKKLLHAKRAAYYLSYIPTILFIGISGSVAMGNAEEQDDIDFFIITKKHTLFMTRLWIHIVLEVLNLRRKRASIDARDTICVNMLIDESRIAFPDKERDLYTAHEVAQLRPLFERNSCYEQFLQSNTWVTAFLPNAYEKTQHSIGAHWKREYVSLNTISAVLSLRPFEKIAAFFQRQYMKRHHTKEIINDSLLAFHPIDYRSNTLASLNTKLRQLGLLTNS